MKNIALVVSDFDNSEIRKNIDIIYPKLTEKYNVTIIAYKGTECEEYADSLVPLELFEKKDGLFSGLICEFKRIMAIRKIAKEKNIRLLVSLSEDSNFAVSYSFVPVKKSICCNSLSYFKENEKKLVKMLKRTDAVLLRNKELGNIFKEKHPPIAGKVKVVDLPVDAERISALSKEPLSEEHANFFKDKNVITVCAPFYKYKGHWNILKAYEILRNTYKKAALVFIGDGGEIAENVKHMASESKYKDSILFAGHQENPYKYIANSKVYVHADITDGGQQYLLEAMATSTPVVATDCMTSEILFDKYDPEFKCKEMTFADNGIITPAFDTRENYSYPASYSEHIDLANAMKEMIVSEKIPPLLKQKALKSLSRYESEKVLKAYVEFVDKLYLCL